MYDDTMTQIGGYNDLITQKPQQRMKVCAKCGTSKPVTPEYFFRKASNPLDGFDYECKACHSERNKAWYRNGGKEKGKKTRHTKSPHRTAFNCMRRRVLRAGKRKFLLGEAGTPEAEAYIKYLETITHCPDCDKKLLWYAAQRGGNNDSASFDRIDSDRDYTKENVRVVCKACNTKKSNHPVDEWVGLLKVRVEKGILEEVDPRLTEYVRRQSTLDEFFNTESS